MLGMNYVRLEGGRNNLCKARDTAFIFYTFDRASCGTLAIAVGGLNLPGGRPQLQQRKERSWNKLVSRISVGNEVSIYTCKSVRWENE